MSGGDGWSGAISGFAFGVIGGAVTGYYSAVKSGLNVWTGNPIDRSKGLTIIGETMKRVEMAAARNRGATILNDMPEFTGTRSQVTSQMMQYNRRWLLNQMRSGNTILDIGVDSARKSSSIFYQMEQSMLSNYQKLHPGALKIIKQ